MSLSHHDLYTICCILYTRKQKTMNLNTCYSTLLIHRVKPLLKQSLLLIFVDLNASRLLKSRLRPVLCDGKWEGKPRVWKEPQKKFCSNQQCDLFQLFLRRPHYCTIIGFSSWLHRKLLLEQNNGFNQMNLGNNNFWISPKNYRNFKARKMMDVIENQVQEEA